MIFWRVRAVDRDEGPVSCPGCDITVGLYWWDRELETGISREEVVAAVGEETTQRVERGGSASEDCPECLRTLVMYYGSSRR